MIGAGIALALTGIAAPHGPVALIVMACGTATPPFDVEVNGKPLVLTPAAQRDDAVELCYHATVALPPVVHVHLRRGGTERVFDLKLAASTKAVTISASDLTARTWDEVPGFD